MGALNAPSAGVICPYEYCFALIGNAVENGVELFLESELYGSVKILMMNLRSKQQMETK